MSRTFVWDETKRLQNIAKHEIDFVDAIVVFEGEPRISDALPSDLEPRWRCSGLLDGNAITVIFTMRNGKTRIISARRARRNER